MTSIFTITLENQRKKNKKNTLIIIIIMYRSPTGRLLSLATALTAVTATTAVPFLKVPACPHKGTVSYSKSVPALDDFPLTQVDLCYTDSKIAITFTAYNETNFYYDPKQGTNGDIWEYEVVEAFIARGTEDPQTYVEYEINPNNVTYQAFVYNPSETRADGAPFDHFFVSDPATDGFTAKTTLDKSAEKWVSEVEIPFALFNVKNGKARGTDWRMNFFRTITSPETYPNQELGAWSPPDKASFHITKFLGHVKFV